MDFTSRMVTLLGAMRRERNGLAADTMRPCGTSYGLNYGVSLPTIRQLARVEERDDDFARYLYRQEVRELRLSAFHLADPQRMTVSDLSFWAIGITNSEIAEEGAFALFSRVKILSELFITWISSTDVLLQYTAMMAAARSQQGELAWVDPVLTAVKNATQDGCEEYAAPLLARGAVALLASLAAREDAWRCAVLGSIAVMPESAAAKYLREELSWRLAD